MDHFRQAFVVDDEPTLCWTLGLIVKSIGMEVFTFTDPREVLPAASEQSPDLLISDVSMPHMSGIELAIQMRVCHPQCKVLLISGHAATEELIFAARENGHDFPIVMKPIHPKLLIAEIRRQVDANANWAA